MATQKLSILTMKCGGCVATVESTLNAINSVTSVDVDLEAKQATIEDDVNINTLIKAVTDSGFPAEHI